MIFSFFFCFHLVLLYFFPFSSFLLSSFCTPRQNKLRYFSKTTPSHPSCMQCSLPMCPYHLADQHLLPIFYAILQTNIFIANFSVILQTNCNCQFFYAILQTNINCQFFRAVLLTNIRGLGKAISIVTRPKSPLPLPLAINSDRSLKKILCVGLIGN